MNHGRQTNQNSVIALSNYPIFKNLQLFHERALRRVGYSYSISNKREWNRNVADRPDFILQERPKHDLIPVIYRAGYNG